MVGPEGQTHYETTTTIGTASYMVRLAGNPHCCLCSRPGEHASCLHAYLLACMYTRDIYASGHLLRSVSLHSAGWGRGTLVFPEGSLTYLLARGERCSWAVAVFINVPLYPTSMHDMFTLIFVRCFPLFHSCARFSHRN